MTRTFVTTYELKAHCDNCRGFGKYISRDSPNEPWSEALREGWSLGPTADYCKSCLKIRQGKS